jgi:hypothetical protein
MGLGNIINLYRIQKLYGLFRKGVDNHSLFKSSEYWTEVFETALAIKEVKEMLKALQGYKTYIIAILTAALTVAHALHYIDDATYQALLTLLASGGVATVAAKINRIQADVDGKFFRK